MPVSFSDMRMNGVIIIPSITMPTAGRSHRGTGSLSKRRSLVCRALRKSRPTAQANTAISAKSGSWVGSNAYDALCVKSVRSPKNEMKTE